MLDKCEASVEAPNLQLMQSLSQSHLALRLRVQRLEFVHLLDEQIGPVEEVLKRKVFSRHSFRPLGRESQQRRAAPNASSPNPRHGKI